jgi:RNA recognition motif-containing protein
MARSMLSLGTEKSLAFWTAEARVGADGKLLQQNDAFKRDANASRKVFVGNLSFKTTEDDLRRNFDKCGEIEFIKVATFEDTGKCKGFAWIRFKEPEAAAWAVKGFVKIKEEVETEEDFRAEQDGGDDDDEPRQKQFKTRKWWVNRMLGRELKLELAEDDHVRYKKRFGKGAQTDGPKGKRDRQANEGGARDKSSRGPQPGSQGLRGADDIQVARLTGAVVKPTGTKTTFDD